ncbi:MAG TPA: hypothetical protein VMU26_14390 [Candidatus Polarisedimenticolia bacterium]|nr:hypothetical protein [Candidatus Polarisedimenticolia bacterium]
MKRIALISLVVFATQSLAQSAVPAGTVLPVRLNSSLNSRKVKPGQLITARVAQDVPLSSGSKIHAGTKVIGHVVDVKRANANRATGAQMSFRFETLLVSQRPIPITSNLRALASMMAIEEAQIPQSGPDRGTSEHAWTTDQIGGEVVYRGDGPVTNGFRVVGEPTAKGVLVHVSGKPGTKCRGEIEGNDRPQALWVFSSDACGAFGFADLVIAHAGRTNPVGEITLESDYRDLNVRAGSGMLLRVNDKAAK